jgi:hypothetical protein
MAMNRIQFQHGMSLPEFLRCFGTEANCAEAVMAARWPNGFACPKCGEQAHCVISVNFRPLFQCNGCHRQTSVTAGTLFAGTKLSLRISAHRGRHFRLIVDGVSAGSWTAFQSDRGRRFSVIVDDRGCAQVIH